jgi:hypothetical protein
MKKRKKNYVGKMATWPEKRPMSMQKHGVVIGQEIILKVKLEDGRVEIAPLAECIIEEPTLDDASLEYDPDNPPILHGGEHLVPTKYPAPKNKP